MDRKHLKCLLWKGLWGLGALSLLFAWSSGDSLTFGMNATYWFWNALIFTALAIPIKLDCHDCSVCMVKK